MRSVASMLAALFALLAGSAALAGAAQAAGGSASLDAGERAIVRAVNQQRSRYGFSRLRTTGNLSKAADYHSWEMLQANYFAHPSRDGGSFERRVRRHARHKAVGETLAMVSNCGRRGARKVVKMWMNSPGHRAILLSSRFQRIGVGARKGSLGSGRTCVVTADFASRK